MCVRILIHIVIIKYSSLIHINTNTKHIHKTNTNNHAQYLQAIIDHKVYSPSYKYKYRSKQCVSEYSQIQLSSNTLLSYISTQTLNTYTKQIQTIMHNTYRLSLTTKCIVHHTNTNIEANNVCQNTHRYSYHQILFSHTNQHKH